MKQKSKLVQQWLSHVEAIVFMKTSALAKKLACQTALLILTSTPSECLLRFWWHILYSSRLILLYSSHLGGRQTVGNCLVHRGTCLYCHTHACSLCNDIDFYRNSSFTSLKITKICTHQKFLAIQYVIH